MENWSLPALNCSKVLFVPAAPKIIPLVWRSPKTGSASAYTGVPVA